jgi:hypothetical protein
MLMVVRVVRLWNFLRCRKPRCPLHPIGPDLVLDAPATHYIQHHLLRMRTTTKLEDSAVQQHPGG